jgi:hypothetical protein
MTVVNPVRLAEGAIAAPNQPDRRRLVSRTLASQPRQQAPLQLLHHAAEAEREVSRRDAKCGCRKTRRPPLGPGRTGGWNAPLGALGALRADR